MTTHDIAAAIKRVESVLLRRPEAGLQEDTPATAKWEGGARVRSCHSGGQEFVTDMPKEMGGAGDQPTPGWLLRAALASCATTRIVMAAASQGIGLHSLEVCAYSRSDARGLLGMTDAAGIPVSAGPIQVELQVRIGGHNVSDARLRSLVTDCSPYSPVTCAMASTVPVTLQITIVAT